MQRSSSSSSLGVPRFPSRGAASFFARSRRLTVQTQNSQAARARTFDNGRAVLRLREGERWIARPSSSTPPPLQRPSSSASVQTPPAAARGSFDPQTPPPAGKRLLSPIQQQLPASRAAAAAAALDLSASTERASVHSSGDSTPSPMQTPRTPLSTASGVSGATSQSRKVSFSVGSSALNDSRRSVLLPSSAPDTSRIRVVATPNPRLEYLLKKIHTTVEPARPRLMRIGTDRSLASNHAATVVTAG